MPQETTFEGSTNKQDQERLKLLVQLLNVSEDEGMTRTYMAIQPTTLTDDSLDS